MPLRDAAIVLCLAALATAGRARAENDPSCAQYQEPMAYNACLARHGPKANVEVGARPGAAQPGSTGQRRTYGSEAPAAGFRYWPRAQRVHGRVHMEFPVR